MLAASAGKIRFDLFWVAAVESDLGGLCVQMRRDVWTACMLVIDFLNSFFFDPRHNSAAKSKRKHCVALLMKCLRNEEFVPQGIWG